jgi:TrmH family RNA methyltransferase
MVKEITSATNPQVKQLRALATSKKARRESGTFIVEGWRGMDTLLTHRNQRFTIEKLVITESWKNDPRRPGNIETILLPEHLFSRISDVKSTQGILAVVRHTPSPFTLDPDVRNYLLLDAIRDPGNLGTLIRSAVGAGFDGVLLYNDCVEPFNPKTIRSTMGTFATIPIWTIGREELDQLLNDGYELCATTGSEGENLYHADFPEKTILAIGSEAHGVSEELMNRAERKITIPLQPECESLNAAIAGSICMFQITRK